MRSQTYEYKIVIISFYSSDTFVFSPTTKPKKVFNGVENQAKLMHAIFLSSADRIDNKHVWTVICQFWSIQLLEILYTI